MRVTKTNLALAGLAILFVGQVAAFSFRAQSEPTPAPGPVGTSVAEVSIETPAGIQQLVPGDASRRTVVLALSSTCTHCTRVDPDWAQWLSSHRDAGVRTLAASKEPLEDPQAYADLHGWAVIAVLKDHGIKADFEFNPMADTRLEAGDHIIVLGTTDQIEKLQAYVG